MASYKKFRRRRLRRLDKSQPLVIATHSIGKLAELRSELGAFFTNITSAADYDLPSPVENGSTFAENALIKAHFVAKATGQLALADDSGFSVPALNGAPGVNTKEFEYATPTVDEAYRKLFEQVGEAPLIATSVLALAWPDGHTHLVTGEIAGVLCYPARGHNGFGFDPYFYVPALGFTFGQLAADMKNQHSHRAKSMQQLLALLQEAA